MPRSLGRGRSGDSLDAEEIRRYKTLQPMDKDAPGGGFDDADDDPLTRALRYIRLQRDLLKTGNAETINEESRLKAWVEMDELAILLQEEVIQNRVRRWIRFDMIFGLVICANAVMMGLTTQEIVDETAAWAQVLEIVFMCFFILEWLIRWYYKRTGIRGMLADTWNLFDLVIIIVSFVDTVILGILDIRSGASSLLAFRAIRLFRLVRLVRLVKLLKKLWTMVSGMMESFRMMCWSLLLLVILCYVFGLLVLEVVRTSSTFLSDPGADVRWGSVLRCMLSMAEIATHNGEKLLKELVQEFGVWVMCIMIVFLFIASLGLLNLIVAVQMTSSLSLAKQDDRYDDLIERLLKHQALRRLREVLLQHCVTTTGSVHVSRGLLMKWVVDQSLPSGELHHGANRAKYASTSPAGSCSSLVVESGASSAARAFHEEVMRPSDFYEKSWTSEIRGFLSQQRKRTSGLAGDFQAAGISEDEIRMLFDEVDSVHGGEASLRVDEFIDSCMLLSGRVHELDLVNLSQGIYHMYWRMTELKTSLKDTSLALGVTSDQVRSLLKKYHTPRQPREEDVQDDLREDLLPEDTADVVDQEGTEVEDVATKTDEDAWQRQALRNEQEAALLNQDMNRLSEIRNWGNFDSAFSIVVLLNAIIFGVEAVLDTDNVVRDIRNKEFDTVAMIWFIIDHFFLLAYLIELVFRTVFHYQMVVQQDFRTVAGFLPKLAFVMDRKTGVLVFRSFPRWLKKLSTFMLLDLFVMISGILENIILRVVFADPSYRKLLKLVALLRLLRIARLLHLVRPLSTLLKAFLSNSKIIFWSLAMLVAMIYAGAIAMVEIVAKDIGNQQDDAIQRKWAHIGSSMLTLAEMVTYSNWGQHIADLQDQGFLIWGTLVVFVGVASLGVINLVVGIMVEVAFHTVVSINTSQLICNLSHARLEVQEAVSRAIKKEVENREQIKAELKVRIMQMCQEELNQNVINDAKEHDLLVRSGTYAGDESAADHIKLRRGTSRNMGTMDNLLSTQTGYLEDSDDEDDSNPADKDWHKKPKCVLNARNHCTIANCFWTADGELAVGISSVEEPNRLGLARDPMQAVFSFDGGCVNPAMFVPDELSGHGDPGVGKRQSGKKEKAEMDGVRPRGKRLQRLGHLFFGQVPMAADLYFQYGSNYTPVRVYPVKSAMTWDEQIRLADVAPVDTDLVTIPLLRVIMQDPLFIRTLSSVKLRPEQALMTYSTLDVVCTGKVRVADFIDGLLRLRRQDVGLDTAGAKSLLRRLMVQATQLAQDSVMCNMCFSQAVQKLRGVSILEEDDETAAASLTKEDEDAIRLAHQTELTAQNAKFRVKLDRLRGYIAQKKLALGVKGELGFRNTNVDPDDDEDSVAMSITSASPGWD